MLRAHSVFATALMATSLIIGLVGCSAPPEQKAWGARKGGLNLTLPKPGDKEKARQANQRDAAAGAHVSTAPPGAAQSDAEWAARSGGLNLTKFKKKDKAPAPGTDASPGH